MKRTKISSSPNSFSCNEIDISDPPLMANKFSEYFGYVLKFPTRKKVRHFNEIIHSLKSPVPGFDGINISELNLDFDHISKPIAYTINLSFLIGIYLAKVTTVYNQGDANQFENYRLISVLHRDEQYTCYIFFQNVFKFHIQRYSHSLNRWLISLIGLNHSLFKKCKTK